MNAVDIHDIILEDNKRKCASFERTKARKVLILQRGPTMFIGDLCRSAGMLWHIKDYFPNAIMDFNFTLSKRQWIYEGLLKDSPYINKMFAAELEDCNLSDYDIIVYVDPDELSLLNLLSCRYKQNGAGSSYAPPIFSVTPMLFRPADINNLQFPLFNDLFHFLRDTKGELYISDEERRWAENWLRDKGVGQDDSVMVVFDDSSTKAKLLNVPVYFEFLQFLLRGKKVKVFNFDERGIGKAEFYKAWLGDQTEKMIFSRRLSLREAICILSAPAVKMIFGPCTGLIHCASHIYNRYKRLGMHANDIPIMITYTGVYPEPQCPGEWWGNSPLVDCIMLKQKGNTGPRLVRLLDLSPEEQFMNDSLPCASYTAGHLINFVTASFQRRSVSLW